jgi:hypothetical protein
VADATGASDDINEFSSFENDMEGWSASGTDLGADTWLITRSQEIAKDGTSSLKFELDNSNDAGKIWIERPFVVERNQIYQVSVEYAIASREFSSITAFTIITGILLKSPRTRGDLIPAFKDDTNNVDNSDVSGFKWRNRKYEFTVRADDQGTLYAVIGIWGTFEGSKTYYFDSVRVTLTKKPQGSEFYSFENDMEGWTPHAVDLELSNDSIDWSIARSQDIWEDGAASVKFDLNNLNDNGKIWIERPFSVEPKKKYKISVDYAFHSNDCGDSPRFKIITGVFRKQPQSGDDLVDAFQGKTTGCVWGWLHKSYEFTVKSKKSDMLYVVIGIRGTEQAHRTYNLDSVCVTVTKK